MFRSARGRAMLWMVAGLLLATVGLVTFVNATERGGIVWSGAIAVGAIIGFRSLRGL